MNPFFPIAAIGAGIALFATSADANVAPIDNSDTGTDSPIDYSALLNDDLFSYPTMMDSNVAAFLAVIRAGESSNNYYAKVGGGNLTTLATYTTIPSVNGSRAVGGYQYQPSTWKEVATALNLTDFSPESQDQGAIFLLKRRGAYNAVVTGQIATACDLLKNEWQMFTLPRWNSDAVASLFVSNGGNLV